MVEIVSTPDSNRCYVFWTAVIHNTASNTGAVRIARCNCKSLCKGPISETVQDSYNSEPFKS